MYVTSSHISYVLVYLQSRLFTFCFFREIPVPLLLHSFASLLLNLGAFFPLEPGVLFSACFLLVFCTLSPARRIGSFFLERSPLMDRSCEQNSLRTLAFLFEVAAFPTRISIQ